MSKILSVLALIGFLGAAIGSAAAQQAPAQRAPVTPQAQSAPAGAGPGPLPPPSIGIVDVVLINQNARAPKAIRDQMEKQLATFSSEMQNRENALRTADQDLQNKRTLLSNDAFNAQRQKFEQELNDAQRTAAARRRQLDQAYNDAMMQVDGVLKTILSEIATERGLTIIMPKQSTLLSANALDLTREVQQRLDAKLTNVAIRLPPLQK